MTAKNKTIINTHELMDMILKSFPGYKSSSLYNKIEEMENSGEITRIGKAQYILNARKVFNYDLESKTAKKVLKTFKQNYSRDFEYLIYEANVVLNQFINHLISRSVTIVEVPKFFANHVFYTLKQNGFKNVMLDPSPEDFYRYVEDYSVVIIPLISKSPIDKKNKKITIEKLVVDIVCSPILNCFYEGAEVPHMIEDMLLNYKVKYDTLRNYAKRRNALQRIVELAPIEIRGLIND